MSKIKTIKRIEQIEDVLEDFLQKKISLNLEKKVIKSGTLLLFRLKFLQNHFYIEFIMRNKNDPTKTDTIKIPIPFGVDFSEAGIYFDYRVKTIAYNDERIIAKINRIAKKKPITSKYYNKILHIVPYE